MGKRSKTYWAAVCLPSTHRAPPKSFDDYTSNSRTVSLATTGLDVIKELVSPANTPAENHELPEQVAKLGQESPIACPISWQLSYHKEVEARMRDRVRSTPESLPIPTQRHESRAAASCNTAGASSQRPISKTQTANTLGGLSLGNQYHPELASPNRSDKPPSYHDESNAILRDTKEQLESVGRAHDQFKKTYADLERVIKDG